MRWPWDRGPTLAEYATEYLSTARPRLARESYQAREQILRLHLAPRLGPIPLRRLGRSDVRGLIAALLEADLAPRTVAHVLAILRAILSEAVRDGLLEANPAAGTWREYRLTPRGPPRHLTTEQLRALTEAVDRSGSPWNTLIGLIWRTGLRRGEALALRWEDVDLPGAGLTVRDTLYHDRTTAGRTKTGRSRVVDLSPAAVALLTRHRAWVRQEALRRGLGHSPEWVFWGPAGGPICPRALNDRFARWRRSAGLPATVTIHGLRHTYAVRALEAGARERYVQAQMGHSSIKITCDLYGAGARLRDEKCLEGMELEADG